MGGAGVCDGLGRIGARREESAGTKGKDHVLHGPKPGASRMPPLNVRHEGLALMRVLVRAGHVVDRPRDVAHRSAPWSRPRAGCTGTWPLTPERSRARYVPVPASRSR
jgi:hypothetical protein